MLVVLILLLLIPAILFWVSVGKHLERRSDAKKSKEARATSQTYKGTG